MPDIVRISQLPAAAALDGTELVAIVQDDTTVQTTAQAIANLGGGGSLKMAFACFDDGATLLPGSQNVNGITIIGTGVRDIDFTDAGFASRPSILVTHSANDGSFADGAFVEIVSSSTTGCRVQIVGQDGSTLLDEGFNFMAVGL